MAPSAGLLRGTPQFRVNLSKKRGRLGVKKRQPPMLSFPNQIVLGIRSRGELLAGSSPPKQKAQGKLQFLHPAPSPEAHADSAPGKLLSGFGALEGTEINRKRSGERVSLPRRQWAIYTLNGSTVRLFRLD